jgi:hypothetical protein
MVKMEGPRHVPSYRRSGSARTWDHWVGRAARADIVVIDPSSSGTLRNVKVSGVLDVMLDVMTIDIAPLERIKPGGRW